MLLQDLLTTTNLGMAFHSASPQCKVSFTVASITHTHSHTHTLTHTRECPNTNAQLEYRNTSSKEYQKSVYFAIIN